MRLHDLVRQLARSPSPDPRQAENLSRLAGIARSFSMDACIPLPESIDSGGRTLVLESGHQPNFLPYPGVWKKAFLLDHIGRQLRELGVDAVPVFGFADYNLSTTPYLSQNRIPAFNKQGTEKIGFRIREKDRWRCFHTLAKPPEEGFRAELERIRRLYQNQARTSGCPVELIRDRTGGITHILEESYHRARNFPDFNAFSFARICTEMFGLGILFFRYTGVQETGLFRDLSLRILNDAGPFRSLHDASLPASAGIPPMKEEEVPFWYHCDCGGKVRLTALPAALLAGTCHACGAEHRIPMDSGSDLDAAYPRMSPDAVARNIIFSEGLGTTLFVSGTGGGLRYGMVSDAISREMGLHRPLTLAWQSRDHYLGVIHHRALRELMRTFGLDPADLVDPAVTSRIQEFRARLDHQIRELRRRGEDKTVISRLEGRFLNSSVQATTVKRVFSATPSIFDLLIACDPGQIPGSWAIAASGAGIHEEGPFLVMQGDVLYPCESGFSVVPGAIPQVHHAMEAIEV